MHTATPHGIPDLSQQINRINWWHQIDLGNGIVTPGPNDPHITLSRIQMPDDLTGKTVLDIGACDGFYSFEAERRGAARVVATDLWSRKPTKSGYRSRDGFDLARTALGSKVEAIDSDLHALTPEKIGKFDVVLFLGVLYHLRNPLLGLERVFALCSGQLILETHVDMVDKSEPAARFYPGDELNNDASNWWGPNPKAVEGMLRAVGFSKVKEVTVATSYRPASSWSKFKGLLKGDNSDSSLSARGRAVFHAWHSIFALGLLLCNWLDVVNCLAT